MNTALENWAKRVIDKVSKVASEAELDFYPLQSEAKMNPEIMFLGLNPGGGATYESQCNNLDWGPKGIPITVERLLLGNPDYEKNAQNWSIIKGLNKIPSFAHVLSNGDYVFANYFYLSTPDFNDVPKKYKNALALCERLTYEFIDIIKPKKIIILGTSSGIDRLSITRRKVLLQGFRQRLLMSGYLNDIPVYAIPHPSTMAITYDEIAALDKNFNECILGNTLTEFSFVPVNWDNFNIEKLNEKLQLSGSKAKFKHKEKSTFIATVQVGVDQLLFTLMTAKNDLYWHLRDELAGKSGSNDRYYANLQNVENYTHSLEQIEGIKSNSFVFKKQFKNYAVTSLEEFFDALVRDILSLEEVIR